MSDKKKLPSQAEDFNKTTPTFDPNPEDLLFLQGYEGEMLRGLVISEMKTVEDREDDLPAKETN